MKVYYYNKKIPNMYTKKKVQYIEVRIRTRVKTTNNSTKNVNLKPFEM